MRQILDSIRPKDIVFKISRPLLSTIVEEACLSLTWSQISEDIVWAHSLLLCDFEHDDTITKIDTKQAICA